MAQVEVRSPTSNQNRRRSKLPQVERRRFSDGSSWCCRRRCSSRCLTSLHTSLQNLPMSLLLQLQPANQSLSDVHRKSLQQSRESVQREPLQRRSKSKLEVPPVTFWSELPLTRVQTQNRRPPPKQAPQESFDLPMSMSDDLPKTAVKLVPQDATSTTVIFSC